MATSRQRYWYLHQNRLALVETPAKSRTVDGTTEHYSTITEGGKKIRIHTISLAAHFNTGADATSADLTSTTTGPLDEIPKQFHEALVYRVIAMGYKTRSYFDGNLAQFFDIEFEKVVRNAKKYSRAGYQRSGKVIQVDF